jgi:hypothetical protein
MKTIMYLALVGSAAAFSPAQMSQTSSALGAYSDFKNEAGVVAPVSLDSSYLYYTVFASKSIQIQTHLSSKLLLCYSWDSGILWV